MRSSSSLLLLCPLLFAAGAPGLSAQSDAKDAWGLFARRDYAAALERLEKEARLYPDWEVVHDAIGWCHYFLGDYAKAEAEFREALARKSDYRWSLEGIEAVADARTAPLAAAQALLDAGRYLEARAEFQRIQEGGTAAGPEALPEALLGEGWCLYSLGRWSEAVAVFRKALKERRGWAQAYRGLGSCEFALADYHSALASFELSFQAEPDDLVARLTAGWCHYWNRDYRRGVTAFEIPQRLAPADYRGWYGRAWCRLRLGQDEAALADFERAVDLSPYAMTADLRATVEARPEWQGLYERTAWSALRARLDSWAAQEFETARRLAPDAPGPRAGQAFADFRLGSYDRAARAAAELEGKVAPASFPVTLDDGTVAEVQMDMTALQGWCWYRLGLYDQALKAFRAVREAHADWVDPVCGEGWVLYSQGNYPAAEQAFGAAARQVPGYPDASSGLAAVAAWRYAEYYEAWSAFDAGRYDEATAAFRVLLTRIGRRFPVEGAPLLHASLGWSLRFAGHTGDARAAFEQALQLDAGCSLAQRGFAGLLMEAREWTAAATHLDAALRDPAWAGSAELLADLGWCRFDAGEALAARDAFERAVAADRHCAKAQAGLGACAMQDGDLIEARVCWERALGFDPTLAERGGLAKRMASETELQKLHATLGWAWLARAEPALAEQQFRWAVERDALEPSAPRGLGLALLRQGRLAEGRAQLETWLAGAPKKENPWGVWSSALSELAWTLYAAGDHKAALVLFRRLGALHAGEKRLYADPFDGAGWCLLGLGKARDARKEFLAAIEIEPRYEHSLQGLEAAREAGQ